MRQIFLLLLCFSIASIAFADSVSTPITTQAAQMQPTTLVDAPKTNLKHFLPNLESNFVHIFSKSNSSQFLFTAIGTGIGSFADDEVHEYFADHHPGGTTENIFATIGKPYVLAPTIATMMLIGQHQHGKFHDFSYALAQAYALNYGIVTSMKFAVGRDRPDLSSTQSFPSGHAADAFMIATVLHNYYGTKAGVFGYSFATLMAASRLKKDKHWFSDVIAGSSIGYIVGSSVCNHMTFHHQQFQMTMMPLVEPFQHRVGLNLYATF